MKAPDFRASFESPKCSGAWKLRRTLWTWLCPVKANSIQPTRSSSPPAVLTSGSSSRWVDLNQNSAHKRSSSLPEVLTLGSSSRWVHLNQNSAHKVVLSACSPYFRKLLKVSRSESELGSHGRLLRLQSLLQEAPQGESIWIRIQLTRSSSPPVVLTTTQGCPTEFLIFT